MDLLIALGLGLRLLLSSAIWSIHKYFPGVARAWQRGLALLDIGVGTFMLAILGLLLADRAWILAAFWMLLVIPSVRGLMEGLRVLVRTAAKDSQ